MRVGGLASCWLILVAACGPSRPATGGPPADAAVAESPDLAVVVARPDAAVDDGCTEANRLVYVLSSDRDLYRFDPLHKQFTLVNRLACQTTMQPNSMAIGRDSVAWVNYDAVDPNDGSVTAGTLFKVDTADASCQPTGINLPANWYSVGMGFASDSVAGTSETLFVDGVGPTPAGGGSGLGQIDLTRKLLIPIGRFTNGLDGKSAELSGTSQARLFGFFVTSPVQVAEIDKTSGAILQTRFLPQVEEPFAWAFAAWGGDFWLFTAPSPVDAPARTSNVHRYHPSDGTVEVDYMTNVGFRIIGAGVSTCAPITIQ